MVIWPARTACEHWMFKKMMWEGNIKKFVHKKQWAKVYQEGEMSGSFGQGGKKCQKV